MKEVTHILTQVDLVNSGHVKLDDVLKEGYRAVAIKRFPGKKPDPALAPDYEALKTQLLQAKQDDLVQYQYLSDRPITLRPDDMYASRLNKDFNGGKVEILISPKLAKEIKEYIGRAYRAHWKNSPAVPEPVEARPDTSAKESWQERIQTNLEKFKMGFEERGEALPIRLSTLLRNSASATPEAQKTFTTKLKEAFMSDSSELAYGRLTLNKPDFFYDSMRGNLWVGGTSRETLERYWRENNPSPREILEDMVRNNTVHVVSGTLPGSHIPRSRKTR